MSECAFPLVGQTGISGRRRRGRDHLGQVDGRDEDGIVLSGDLAVAVIGMDVDALKPDLDRAGCPVDDAERGSMTMPVGAGPRLYVIWSWTASSATSL